MYIVENSHPAIVSREVFNRAQEELSRRKARAPQSTKGAITSTGKYSKYALTDVLICGECGSHYKRCTWTSRDKKRIVWRCVSRLDYGKKYCKDSPALEEQALQAAIVRALNRFNEKDESTYRMLMKATIGDAIGLTGGNDEINLLECRIVALNKEMMELVNASVMGGEGIENHEDEFRDISQRIEQFRKAIRAMSLGRKELRCSRKSSRSEI